MTQHSTNSAAAARSYVPLVALGCIALVVFQLLGYDVAAAASKIVASTVVVILATRMGALTSAFGRFILIGLVLSWFGDALLIEETSAAFLAGLGAFLLAHVAYISAFAARGLDRRTVLLALLPVLALGAAVSVWLTPHMPAELLLPVHVYTIAISLMVVAAIGTFGHERSMLIVAGALMFFLSDLSVAALRLVQTEFPTYVWGLPLYYAAQVCLALSTLQSRPQPASAG